MEMALRPQSPLCPRSRPAFFVRPAGSRGGGLAQSFLMAGRFTGSRIVRCMAASSDYPNRKSWRMVSPQIKFTASRGYAPRLTAESSTKKREHSKSDEETLGTYNRLLSIDAAEWTGSREVETAEVDLSQNASSSSTIGEVDAADEDIFEVDLPGNSLSSVTMGEVDAVDEARLEEDIFEVDMPGNALSSLTMGEVDAVEEAGVEENIFEVDLSGNALSNVTMGGVNAVDKAGVEEDIFEVDLSETALSSVAMGEVNAVDEAGAEEDIFEVDLSGLALSRATMEEVDVVDEAGAVKDTFEADLSGNVLSNATYGEVNAMDETMAEEVTFDMDLLGNSSSSARLEEVIGARAEEETFEMDLLGSVSGNAKQMAVDSVGEAIAKEETYQQHPALSSTSMEGKAIDDTPVSLKPELMPLVRVQEQDKSIFGVHEQEGSIVNFHEQNQSMVDFHEQEQPITAFDKQHQPIARFPKQDQSIAGFPEQNQSIVASHKQDQPIVDFPEENQSIIGSYEQDKSIVDVPDQIQSIVDSSKQHQSIVAFRKQDQSIVDVPEQIQSIVVSSKQHQSIVAFRKQNQSIVDVPEQIQSIVGSSKQDQSIVAFCKQNQSIVDVPEQIQSIVGSSKQHLSIVASRKQDQSIVSVPVQKQSIVGFHKQDLSIVGFSKQNLSIVGTSGESQTKQVASVARHDALHVKGVEAKDGDYTSQKTDGDVLHVKFDVDNLLQRHMADSTKEAVEMTTSKKVYEEHLSMTEDQISAAEEQRMVTEDGLSIAEVEVGMVDKLQHVLSEEELSWAEDEVGLIEDEEQYEVDETSTSAEPDIHESPQEDVDPQALRMMLQELADKKYSMGNKLFVFPEVVKADSVIDLYLNRDLSALASEPDVLIKGAFNGWRWRLFTERLHKSELGGDWWHCKLYIPTQAYRLDFVFFNGRTVYENNDSNDFVIQIESTMDEYLFENFLDEEKQRELQRLAIEEAERRRQAEEQQRREEERAADEADRAQAKAEVETKKNKFHNVLGSARTCADNLWYIEPTTHRREDTVRLYYNRHSRPLVHSTEIWMHGGYNNWTNGLSIAERLVQCDDKDGDWWYADVILPEKAFVLDWVFADGPPGNARNYDNNGQQDFHAILPNVMTEENYWVEEEQSIYTRLLQERREREEAMKRKAERSAKMKAEMKEKTMRMFLLSQKHIVYTEPLEIRAGTTVDVLYNPYNTVLNGKLEVWFRFSFNRWTHPGGLLPPQKMVKAKDGSLLKATVSVPLDAYMMDFVFSESEEGGIYDNRNGVDYHIPVFGSIAKEPPMHIVHIAVEMAPIAKVGGLGDVVTSLSRAVQDLGHNVEVILPKYDCLNLSNVRNLHLHQSFSWGGTEIKVWFGLVENLSVYFLEPQNGMFGVGCVYGRNDDRRFGFFCHSALEFLLQNGSSPHIIHCHDWSSAPVAWLYKEHYAQSRLADARVVFTIHNLEFGAYYIGKAMTYCDKATTVSHTYSREVSGHGAIAPNRGKFYGILNGIDQDIWDPYTDNFLPVHYSSENVVEGKNAAKKALQQKLGLQQTDVPIVGIVTRLTAQKGIHLIKHAIHWTLEHNGQVVLLGSAPDPRIQSDFCNLANTLHGVNHGRVRLCLTYDEPLSHLIYAGSDFILVPSIFEPCGLTQLVAMRYGSIPVVRRTGGLYDTVFDVDHDKDRARSHGLEPNGFSFDGADSNGLDYALNRAISAWFDARDWFHSLCKRVMEQDWSWNRPALDYLELYHSARKC